MFENPAPVIVKTSWKRNINLNKKKSEILWNIKYLRLRWKKIDDVRAVSLCVIDVMSTNDHLKTRSSFSIKKNVHYIITKVQGYPERIKNLSAVY